MPAVPEVIRATLKDRLVVQVDRRQCHSWYRPGRIVDRSPLP
jgi:hypothetical protein